MPRWISLGEAVSKYGVEEEVIWLWVEMKRITVSYAGNYTMVDNESIQKFLNQNKGGIRAEYINALEQLCIQKMMICAIYSEVIDLQERELQQQKQ